MKRREDVPQIFYQGWYIYILQGSDGGFATGMTKNLKKTVAEINNGVAGEHFLKYPEKLPVKVIWKEGPIRFREAYAKCQDLKGMNHKWKTRFLERKKWFVRKGMKKLLTTLSFKEIFGYDPQDRSKKGRKTHQTLTNFYN